MFITDLLIAKSISLSLSAVRKSKYCTYDYDCIVILNFWSNSCILCIVVPAVQSKHGIVCGVAYMATISRSLIVGEQNC